VVQAAVGGTNPKVTTATCTLNDDDDDEDEDEVEDDDDEVETRWTYYLLHARQEYLII
jgi:hypothetical protein